MTEGNNSGDQSGDTDNTSNTGGSSGGGDNAGSGGKTYSESDYNALLERSRNFEGKLTDFEKRFGGIDPDQYKKDKDELESLRRKQMGKPDEEFDNWKASETDRLEGIYKDKLESTEGELDKLRKRNKTLEVTNVVMKDIQESFAPSFADLLRQTKVEKYCDLKDGKIVIVDDDGEVRRSPNRPAENMSVEEYVAELKETHPDGVKSNKKGGDRFMGDRSGSSQKKGNSELPTLDEYRNMPRNERIKQPEALVKQYSRELLSERKQKAREMK